VLALYRCQPQDGVDISFSEMRPVSLCPHQGRGWAHRHRPERHRATHRRRHGLRYLVGALDVHADYLGPRPRLRRDGNSTLTFTRQIRLAYPRSTRIYWIQDNLSCHWTTAIRHWAERSNVELVPTPTYASYLKRIESRFGAIGEFVVKNADYLDWDSFALAMSNHISYRNDPRRRRERLERAEKRLRLAA
jgi:transposase